MEDTKVKIVIKNGMVSCVYANNPIKIEILDLDTQDEDELKNLENEIAEYENNYIAYE